MASLGELFVELGVVGDVKPLEKAIGTMKEAVKQIDNEIKANQRLLKYLQDIKNARNDGEKATIKENFAKEIQKQKMLNEIDANQKAVDGKKEFASKIAGVVKGVGAFVGALTGAAIALNKFTNDLVESNQAMLNLTRTSDISLKTFQKWDSIGRMFGVQNAAQQIEGLNQRLFQLRLTGEGAGGFQIAGINPIGQDAEGVLEQLRQRIKGLDDTSASWLLQQMGLDPQMLNLLRMEREEFEKLNKELENYRLTDEQRRSIQQMNIYLEVSKQKLQYLKDRAILAIMPAWVKLVESFARVAEMLARVGKKVGEFVLKWRGLIAGGVLFLSRFKPVAEFLTKTSLIFKEIGASISKLILKIPVLGKFLGALGGWAAKILFPFTAFYLLLDDIATFMEGGDSLIGEVFGWLKEQGGDFSKIFSKMFGGDFLGGITDLFVKLIDILDDVVQVFLRIGEILTGLPLTDWGKKFANFVSGGHYDDLKNYDYGALTPQVIKNSKVDNRQAYNNDNRQVSQNIQITTTQPAFDIERELRYANMAFA